MSSDEVDSRPARGSEQFKHPDDASQTDESQPSTAPLVNVTESLLLKHCEEREHDEAALLRRTEELTDFVENATVGLHWVGPDGTILWANRAELDLLGYTCEEYVGRNIADFHVDLHVIADILKRLTAKEELHSYEARLRCKDGSVLHVVMSSSVYSKDGKFIHSRCFTRDVTERKRLEDELNKQREYWRVALSSIGDATMLTDAEGRVSFMNPVAE